MANRGPYSEGPFRNWTAIHFPGTSNRIAARLAAGVISGYLKVEPLADAQPTSFARIMTGTESEFAIDWTNVPELDATYSISNSTVTLANINPYTQGPWYHHLTGEQLTWADLPAIGLHARINAEDQTNTPVLYKQGMPYLWRYLPAWSTKEMQIQWVDGDYTDIPGTAELEIFADVQRFRESSFFRSGKKATYTYGATVATWNLTTALNSLAADIESVYPLAARVSGTSIFWQPTDSTDPFSIGPSWGWSKIAGTGTSVIGHPFAGTITSAAPALGFDFGGAQTTTFISQLNYDLAEPITFTSPPEEE